jgi:hypothetical protein
MNFNDGKAIKTGEPTIIMEGEYLDDTGLNENDELNQNQVRVTGS